MIAVESSGGQKEKVLGSCHPEIPVIDSLVCTVSALESFPAFVCVYVFNVIFQT